MIGFWAGAGLTLQSALRSKAMKLAFIGPIYGGVGPVDVPKDAPPMFNVIAADDFLFRGQFGVVKSSFDAGRSVEFHLLQNGGHGFGLGYPGSTASGWFPAFMCWLGVSGFLAGKANALAALARRASRSGYEVRSRTFCKAAGAQQSRSCSSDHLRHHPSLMRLQAA